MHQIHFYLMLPYTESFITVSHTRPDIVFAVNRVSQFMQQPTAINYTTIKHIILISLWNTWSWYFVQIWQAFCRSILWCKLGKWFFKSSLHDRICCFSWLLSYNLICQEATYYFSIVYQGPLAMLFSYFLGRSSSLAVWQCVSYLTRYFMFLPNTLKLTIILFEKRFLAKILSSDLFLH